MPPAWAPKVSTVKFTILSMSTPWRRGGRRRHGRGGRQAGRYRRQRPRRGSGGGSPAASDGGGVKGHNDGAPTPSPAATIAYNHADGRLPLLPTGRDSTPRLGAALATAGQPHLPVAAVAAASNAAAETRR